MSGHVGVYEGLLVLTTLATGTVAGFTWRRRDEATGTFLTLVLVGTVGWSSTALVGSLFPGTQLALNSVILLFTFVSLTVTSVFLVAVSYTNRESWLGPRLYALLAVEPVAVTVAAWVNPGDLFWTVEGVVQHTQNGWVTDLGPLFWAHTAYSYVLLVAVTVWFAQFAISADRTYRRQVVGVLVSTFPPWIANVVYLAGFVPVDPTPFAFAITALGLTWTIHRARLLDITPIAREAVVDTINDAVVVVDDQGRIVDTNPAFAEFLSVDGGLVGRQLETVLDPFPEVRDRYAEIADRGTETTITFETETAYYTADVSPLSDVRGDHVGHVVVVHDLTEQKRRQLELERRNRQLDQFASVVSHDLRNPLNVARGRLELLAREADCENSDHVEAIERSHGRMETLIDDLLTLARTDGDPDTEQVVLGSVARSAWDHVATPEATLEVEDGTVTVEADPDRLTQLLENAFRNSVEHGGAGVTVTVATLPDQPGFAVVDDGDGFDDADADDVFEEGYTTADGGTGLGLSIVAAIAEQHGWSVRARESTGGGARLDVVTGSVPEKTVMVD